MRASITLSVLLLLDGTETFRVPARAILRHERFSPHGVGSVTPLVGTAKRARSSNTIGMSVPPPWLPTVPIVIVIRRYHVGIALLFAGLALAMRAAERGRAVFPFWVRATPSRPLQLLTPSPPTPSLPMPSPPPSPPPPPPPLPPSPTTSPPSAPPSPSRPTATELSTTVLDPAAWTEQALEYIKSRPTRSSFPTERYDTAASWDWLSSRDAHERQARANVEDGSRAPRWTALVAAATSAGESQRGWKQTSEPGVWKGSE